MISWTSFDDYAESFRKILEAIGVTNVDIRIFQREDSCEQINIKGTVNDKVYLCVAFHDFDEDFTFEKHMQKSCNFFLDRLHENYKDFKNWLDDQNKVLSDLLEEWEDYQREYSEKDQ